MQLTGFHHLTAVSASIKENHRFYTQTLGMRLVKRSVNQDDVSAYHLFYADAKGTPGTDITFFDWPVPREQRGTRSIVRTCLRVRSEATLKWWGERFDELEVSHGEIVERDGRLTLQFEDPEGQRLALVDDGGTGDPPTAWDRSPVPAEHQIRGLGPIVISVPTLESDRRAADSRVQHAAGSRLPSSRTIREPMSMSSRWATAAGRIRNCMSRCSLICR